MDETPVPYVFGGRFGTRSKRQLDPTKRLKRQTPPLRVTRGHATLVASMCTEPIVQKHLPQVFMPNTKGMKKKWEGVSATADLPDNIRVQMGTTGWQTIPTMMKYIALLKRTFRTLKVKKAVLVMDCHPSHYSPRTLSRIAKQNWRVLLIPSKLTWLLQPLDAYMFAQLKRKLHDTNIQQQTESEIGQQTFQNWATTCFNVVSESFKETEGQPMFNKCGYSLPSTCISDRVMQFVDMAALPNFRRLTEDELSVYIGKKSAAIHPLLFAQHVPACMCDRRIVVHRPLTRLTSKRSQSEL